MTKTLIYTRKGFKTSHALRPPAYIIVYQFRPKGTPWYLQEQLAVPEIFNSQSEASAAFELMGFDPLYRWKPETAIPKRYKVSASFENARVWLKSMKRQQEERLSA